MATCRRCYNTNVKIPSSPRPISNIANNKENSSDLSNALKRKSESDNLTGVNDTTRDSITNDLPPKKALFVQD